MAVLRCEPCLANYPNYETFETCPVCLLKTKWQMFGSVTVDEDAALELAKPQERLREFEEWLMDNGRVIERDLPPVEVHFYGKPNRNHADAVVDMLERWSRFPLRELHIFHAGR